MNNKQLKILWLGIGIFALVGLFPPTGSSQWPYVCMLLGAKVDVVCLCIHWAAIAVVTGGLIYTLKVDPKLKDTTNKACFLVALAGLLVGSSIVFLAGIMNIIADRLR